MPEPTADRCAVLYPAVAEATHRLGAQAVALIGIGRAAEFDLQVDRVGITYSNGQVLGDPSSAVQLTAAVVGDRPLPTRAIPEVVARLAVDLAPVAVAEAVAHVPADASPVVLTAWALSSVPVERRPDFLHRLADAAAGRAVAWVSVEGVGVAPSIPTLGDRPASGHSLIGLAVFDRSRLRADVLGRCWSRGRWLSWLAAP
jgi:hypothetical protein